MKEHLESSTWRELLAIEEALKYFAPLLQNTSIHVKTDNFGTSVITRKGSNKTSLQEFAENGFLAAADAISKLIDYDDWQTTVKFFQKKYQYI